MEVKWACASCTLLNSATARKCKACDAPNPSRPVTTRREKPSQTLLSDEGEEVFTITEFRHPGGLMPAPMPAPSADQKRPVVSSGGRSMPVAKRPRAQAEWDREMQLATTLERPEEVKQIEREQRDERSRQRNATSVRDPEHDVTAIPVLHEMPRAAPVPLMPLDFSEASSSIEAQLLARGTFSLDIKSVDRGVVRVIWCFPTANPGDCNAWISLAAASRVVLASARQKFKLLTKNKVCGEVRFTNSDVRKLHDGEYAFGLHATVNGQQCMLAVSQNFYLVDGEPSLCAHELEKHQQEEGLVSRVDDVERVDEKERGEHEIGDSDQDEAQQERDEEGSEGQLELSEAVEEPARQRRRRLQRQQQLNLDQRTQEEFDDEMQQPPLQQQRRRQRRGRVADTEQEPELDQHQEEDQASELGGHSDPQQHQQGRPRRSEQSVSLQEGGHMFGEAHSCTQWRDHRVDDQKRGGDGRRISGQSCRWAPRLDDRTFRASALLVLAALQRGALRSEMLLHSLGQSANVVAARRFLLATLRLLVRVGFIVRTREREITRPMYMLSSRAREWLSAPLSPASLEAARVAVASAIPPLRRSAADPHELDSNGSSHGAQLEDNSEKGVCVSHTASSWPAQAGGCSVTSTSGRYRIKKRSRADASGSLVPAKSTAAGAASSQIDMCDAISPVSCDRGVVQRAGGGGACVSSEAFASTHHREAYEQLVNGRRDVGRINEGDSLRWNGEAQQGARGAFVGAYSYDNSGSGAAGEGVRKAFGVRQQFGETFC
uniref:RanBP2-type domain-containing protein n=1 Tax=Haptolina ericina TaxID=156174 RepID=A0A7S3ABF9_9EUKA